MKAVYKQSEKITEIGDTACRHAPKWLKFAAESEYTMCKKKEPLDCGTRRCLSTAHPLEEREGKFRIETVGKDKRNPDLTNRLLKVWEASVRASHHFLTETDIERLTPQAENALREIETLRVVKDNSLPVGFMGVQERKIEMLFLHPDYFRKGLGKELVQRAFEELDVEFVDVNEQNPDAIRFYRRMGFNVFKHNECDSEGNPFPILEMKRQSTGPENKAGLAPGTR